MKRIKRIVLLCAVGALALAAGCKPKGPVTLDPNNLPECDTADIDDIMEITQKSASDNRMMLILDGTARQELAQGVSVNVARYKGEERLQPTKTAFITYAGEPKVTGEEGEAFEPVYNEARTAVIGPGGVIYPLGPDGKRPIGADGRYMEWAEIYGAQASAAPDTIEEGDPIKIQVDATIEGGRITKLVFTPSRGSLVR